MTSQFGTLLRQLRRQAGLTQERLAERSGVGVRTIRRLETGEPTDPRMGTVKLLADALDVTPDERRKLLSEGGEDTAVPQPVPAHSATWTALAGAADELAQVVGDRWRREEEHRRIHDPFPLPVRWEPVPEELTDSWENIRRAPAGVTSGPLELAGELAGIAEVHRRIPSGRLVVLGRAGSGKSVLTVRFVLDQLMARTSADPVPVIFSLGSWDPTATALRDWLIGELLRDYPGLAASAHGRSTLAAALVGGGHILPVLDGFDEIADGLHRPALEALNATSLPLLLTSRPGEFAAAVAAIDVLTWAAVVELTDLTPTDLADYLPRTARRVTTGTRWDPVLVQLREPAGADLAAVLTTPLMVVLARTIYSDAPGQDPADLLDATRFPTRDALEDHLLGSFVPTVYRQRPPHLPAGGPRRRDWDPDLVQRWLGYLADHLDRSGTHDLAWWRLGNSLRRSTRILTVVVATTLATAFVDWIFFVPLNRANGGIGAGLLDGLMVGPVVGLAFGLVYGLMIVYGGVVFEPARMQVRLLSTRRAPQPHHGRFRRYIARFGGGLLGGFVVGLGYGPLLTLTRGMLNGFPADMDVVVQGALINTLVFGLVFGLSAGLMFVLATAFETPLDIRSAANPIALLTVNRRTVVRQIPVLGLMLTLTITFGGGVVVALLQDALGPLLWELPDSLIIGAVGGFGGGLSYGFAFTAWGQWLLQSRVWLPLTGKLPWAMIAFLDDAYERGVLRQAGAVYQFRHARLQDHFSRAHRRSSPKRSQSHHHVA